MYGSWHRQLERRLIERSFVQNTARGPVEYAVLGEGSPMLVLHGVIGGYDQGLAIAESIGLPGCRFIAVSRPGYLRTPLETGRTYEQQADACAAFLDSLGIASAVTIGVSGGGPAALEFARKYGGRCSGLILLSAVTKRLVTPERPRPMLFRLADFAGWLMHGAVRRNPAFFTRGLLLPAETEMLKDPAMSAAFLRFLDTSVPFSLRSEGLMNDGTQMGSIADAVPTGISCPTLIVHGTADRIVPYEHATAAAKVIPGSRLVAIEGGGHFAALFRASEVRQSIRDFLATANT